MIDHDPPVVAAFDFDGTLTYHDTLLPFLVYTHGFWKAVTTLARLSPWLVQDAFKGASRQPMKERVLGEFYGGKTTSEMRDLGVEFAKHHLTKHLRPEAMERFQWHRQQGHLCVLVSASVDTYLIPWAQIVGFDKVATSLLEIDERNRITGKLVGKNCWGPEKVRRLQELVGPKEGYVLYAYGDTRGDRELLEYADHSFYRRME